VAERPGLVCDLSDAHVEYSGARCVLSPVDVVADVWIVMAGVDVHPRRQVVGDGR
jgi:hypothetical protein